MNETSGAEADRLAAERIAIDLGLQSRPTLSDEDLAEFRRRFTEAQKRGPVRVLDLDADVMLLDDAAVLNRAAGVIERRAHSRGIGGRFVLGVQLRLLRSAADRLSRKAGAEGLTQHPAGRKLR